MKLWEKFLICKCYKNMTEKHQEHTPPNVDRYRNGLFVEIFGRDNLGEEFDVDGIVDILIERWGERGNEKERSEELSECGVLIDYVNANRTLYPESRAWASLSIFLRGRGRAQLKRSGSSGNAS